MRYKIPVSIILICLICLPAAYADKNTDNAILVFENAWIAEAPPVSKVLVAYMTIKNQGPTDIEITNAASETFSSIEFHETINENGMASMVRHESLDISANGQLDLQRGGPHLMLFNPVRPLKAGDTVNITFRINNNTTRTVTVAVKKRH